MGLKCIDLVHLFVSQCTIDIFFIDWERGRRSGTDNAKGDAKAAKAAALKDTPSIWRTYFCANEWNEIQTYRKLNIV